MHSASVDIRPFACPLTWVKTRIALERMADGEVLEVLLAAGEPLDNVPRSAELEGHAILLREPCAGGWRILIRKVMGKGRAEVAALAPWEA